MKNYSANLQRLLWGWRNCRR